MGGRLNVSHDAKHMDDDHVKIKRMSDLSDIIQTKMIKLTLETAAIRIQTCYRVYKRNKRPRKVRLQTKQTFGLQTQTSADFFLKQSILQGFKCSNFLIYKLNQDNLNHLMSNLTSSYQNFFKSAAEGGLNYHVHEAILNVGSGIEFEEKNKELILGFMFKNKELDKKFSWSSNNYKFTKVQKKWQDKCCCSENLINSGSNINQQSTTNSLDTKTKQSIGFHSKANSDASNILSISQLSQNFLSKRKTYSIHYVSSSKEKRCAKSSLINSESNPVPFFHNLIKSIELKAANAKLKTEFEDENYLFEGLAINSEKIGVGFYYRYKPEKNRKYIYHGYFNHNKFEGVGIILKDNGYSFQGEFREGKRTGYGYECKLHKFSYDGFFHNDQYNGYGVLINIEKKYSYYGNFVDGKKEGWGYHTYSDGGKYSGEFIQDQRSGTGLMVWKEGHAYRGSWIKDKMHGIGSFKFKQGDEYQGQFVSGIKHGIGQYTYKSGATLKGKWYNGRKEGFFIFCSTDGQTSKLEYKNDLQI